MRSAAALEVRPPARQSVCQVCPALLVHARPSVRPRMPRPRPSRLLRPAGGLRSPVAARACCARPSVSARKPRAWRDIATVPLYKIMISQVATMIQHVYQGRLHEAFE